MKIYNSTLKLIFCAIGDFNDTNEAATKTQGRVIKE